MMFPGRGSDASKPLYLAIADHLEREIISGRLGHNMRLPITKELARQFNVTIPTVQQGLARLAEKGLLRRSPKLGTFVNAAPLSRSVGIVTGWNPFATETKYDSLLLEALRHRLTEEGFSHECHFGLIREGFEPGLRKLKEDIAAGRYGALVIIDTSSELNNWLDTQESIPWFIPPGIDHRHCAEIASDYLLERGFTDLLFVPLHAPERRAAHAAEKEGFLNSLARHQITASPSRVAYLGGGITEAYERAKKLFAKRRNRLPQAIIVNHDCVTKGLLIALSELGIRIPADLALVTHANKGDSFLTPIPLTRCEVDPALVATQTIASLQEHYAGARPTRHDAGALVRTKLVPGKSCGE